MEATADLDKSLHTVRNGGGTYLKSVSFGCEDQRQPVYDSKHVPIRIGIFYSFYQYRAMIRRPQDSADAPDRSLICLPLAPDQRRRIRLPNHRSDLKHSEQNNKTDLNAA